MLLCIEKTYVKLLCFMKQNCNFKIQFLKVSPNRCRVSYFFYMSTMVCTQIVALYALFSIKTRHEKYK